MREGHERYPSMATSLAPAYRKEPHPRDEDDERPAMHSHPAVDAPRRDPVPLLGAARAVCIVASFAVLAAFVQAQETLRDEGSTTQARPPYLRVELAGELVSIEARDARIKDLLEELARQRGLVVISRDPLDERITLELEPLPLPKAMARVLGGRSFALQEIEPSTARGSPIRLPATRLWVFSSGRAGEAVPPDTVVRLGGSEGEESIASLWGAALVDPDPNVRQEAAAELAIVGDEQAVPALATAALRDESASVRTEAIHALGAIGGEAIIPILEQSLRDPDPTVREAVIDALTDIGGDASIAVLAVALNDEDASLRAEAVDSLGEIGGERAIQLLRRALGDAQRSIREAAAEYLLELSGEKP